MNTLSAAHEGIYIVRFNSKLYAESPFTPFFEFEVYLHPSPCVHTVINPNGTIKVPDFSYEIHPANIQATTEFNTPTPTPDTTCVLQFKFTFDPANPTLQSLLTKETTTSTNLNLASTLTLTETAAKVKIGFKFIMG